MKELQKLMSYEDYHSSRNMRTYEDWEKYEMGGEKKIQIDGVVMGLMCIFTFVCVLLMIAVLIGTFA